MNAFTPPQTIRRSIARSLSEVPAPKTYEDYLADGRIWAEERIAKAAASWGHTSQAPDSEIERHARMFAEIHAPVAVRADWAARCKAARDLEFGA